MPVTPTIEVDDTLKERSSHGSFELPILIQTTAKSSIPSTTTGMTRWN